MLEFQPWPKIPRLFNQPNAQSPIAATITEKIDGTNSAVVIVPVDMTQWSNEAYEKEPMVGSLVNETGTYFIYAQSRKRFLNLAEDNFGFAKWVFENVDVLVNVLGPGTHFGEWWGQGIQRGYGLDHKKFSLFNTSRWDYGEITTQSDGVLDVVPIIAEVPVFTTQAVNDALDELRGYGSEAAPGFMKPEGVVVYHHPSGQTFKAFVDDREKALESQARALESGYEKMVNDIIER